MRVSPNPSIESLSPPGAVVGGAPFSLTVLGSNFGTQSTVTWNQSPRTTAFVSATHLTAAISAADIAATVPVNVAVSNQGAPGTPPLLSNSVTFSIIPDISEITNQLKQIAAVPAALLTELQTYLTLQQSQVDSLTTQVNTDQTTEAALKSTIATQSSTIAQQQTQINTLEQQIAATKVTTASPLDVAQSFKNVVDQIRQTAQGSTGVQTTLANMNVQVKALLNVQSATSTTPAAATLIFPDPTALPDAQQLSTVSFSFGAIPNLSAVAAGLSGSPATPAPSPAPSPAPAPAARPAPSPGPAPAPSPPPAVTAPAHEGRPPRSKRKR